jgi:hypothetical protein
MKKRMSRQALSLGIAFLLAATLSAPAFGDDDTGPVVRELSISPQRLEVSSGPGNLRFRLSATDQSGVKQANVQCDPRGVFQTFLMMSFYMDQELKPSRLWNSGTWLPLASFEGTDRDFVVEFDIPIRSRETPGKYYCSMNIVDRIGKQTVLLENAQFVIVRDGIGDTTPTPTPTPTPSRTPTPAPTPTPTPTGTITPTPAPTPTVPQNCKYPHGTKCLDDEGFIFIKPKFSSNRRGAVDITWGSISLDSKHLGYTVLEKRREAKKYKTIATKSQGLFIQRRGLKPGVYDYVIRVKLLSGLTKEIVVSGRVK